MGCPKHPVLLVMQKPTNSDIAINARPSIRDANANPAATSGPTKSSHITSSSAFGNGSRPDMKNEIPLPIAHSQTARTQAASKAAIESPLNQALVIGSTYQPFRNACNGVGSGRPSLGAPSGLKCHPDFDRGYERAGCWLAHFDTLRADPLTILQMECRTDERPPSEYVILDFLAGRHVHDAGFDTHASAE